MRLNGRVAVFAVSVLAVWSTGCGDADVNNGSNTGGLAGRTEAESTADAPAPAPAPTGSATTTIKMSEFKFDPKDATAQAGKVTITTPNEGKAVHELVVLKTGADPAKLPMKGGAVDESTSVGEIADVEPGATKTGKFNLKPGKYAMVCALPGHYEGGMYGSLTVK